jgi:hypothetical protein
VLERGAVAQVLHFGLNEGAQVTGRAVLKFDYAARVAIENNDVALTDLRCWDWHFVSFEVRNQPLNFAQNSVFFKPAQHIWPNLFAGLPAYNQAYMAEASEHFEAFIVGAQ